MSINTKDSTTTSSAVSKLTAQISYPSAGGKSYSNCSTGCTGSMTTGSDVAQYYECKCSDLSALSSKTQTKSVFAKSDLYKIALASALVNFNYLGSWAFWMLWVAASWLFLTLFLIKATIIRPMKYAVGNGGRHCLRKNRLVQIDLLRIEGNKITFEP